MIVVVVIVVVIAVVVMIPVTFVHLPATVVVVVVGMLPIRARKGWPAPFTTVPGIAAAFPIPVAIGPNVAGARDRGAYFIT